MNTNNSIAKTPKILYSNLMNDSLLGIDKVPVFTKFNKKWSATAFGYNHNSSYTNLELNEKGIASDTHRSAIAYGPFFVSYFNSVRPNMTFSNMTNQEKDNLSFHVISYCNQRNSKFFIMDIEGDKNANGDDIYDYNDINAWNSCEYIINKVKNSANINYLPYIFNRYGISLPNKQGRRLGNESIFAYFFYSSNDILNVFNGSEPVSIYSNQTMPYYVDDVGYTPYYFAANVTQNPSNNKVYYFQQTYLGYLSFLRLFDKVMPSYAKYYPYFWLQNDRDSPVVNRNRYKLTNTLKGVSQGQSYNGYIETSRDLPLWSAKRCFNIILSHLMSKRVDSIDNWSDIDSLSSLTPMNTEILHQNTNPCNIPPRDNAPFNSNGYTNYTDSDYVNNCIPNGSSGYIRNTHKQLNENIRAAYFYNHFLSDILNGNEIISTIQFSYKRENEVSFTTVNNPNDRSECVRAMLNKQPFITIYLGTNGKYLVEFEDLFTPVGKNTQFSFTLNGITYNRLTEDNDKYLEII